MGTTAFPLPIDLGPTRAAAEAAQAAAEAVDGRIPAAPANEAGLVATVDTRVTGPAALEATLQVVKGYLDTEIAAILAAVDTEVAAIKAKTDLVPAIFPLTEYRIKAAPASGQILLPDGAAMLTTSEALSAFVWGAWVQIVAATPFAGYVAGVQFTTAGNSDFELQIGSGAGGAEVPLVTIPASCLTAVGAVSRAVVPFSAKVATGIRLAFRQRSAGGGGKTVDYFKVVYVRESDLEAF